MNFEIWNTYVSPFEEPFEVDGEVIVEISLRQECGETITDEEFELLKKHHDWIVDNSRKRLPINRCCPSKLINRARRYEKLVSLNAPRVVVEEEGRFLAEEMVLYYHKKY